MAQRIFSRKEALLYGWGIMKTHLGLFVPLCLLTWLVSAISGALQRPAPGPFGGGSKWLLGLAIQLFGVVLSMGWIRVCLLLHDRREASLARVFEVSLPLYLNFLITMTIYVLVVALGVVLLVVPGVLWGIRYGLAPFLVIDQGLDPWTALRRSGDLTEGAKEELFLFGLLLLGVNLLGAMALGVGLLASVPTSMMALAYVYRRLLLRKGSPSTAASPGDLGEHPATA